MQKSQENQLYVFDPKALHQIVKVRSIFPDYLPSTPFVTRSKTFTKCPRRLLSIWHSYFRWPSHWNTILRQNKLMFGPGLLAILGEYIRSSIHKAINKIYLPGEQHRKQRKMLNPVFSIAHLRGISELCHFGGGPRTERTIVSTFYHVSYKVPLRLNLSIWR